MDKKYIKRTEDTSREYDPRCETFILNTILNNRINNLKMNKTILENNKTLHSINFNYNAYKKNNQININKLHDETVRSFDDYADSVKYRNKFHNQKIQYVLNGMDFKIEQNVFKKVLVGFGLIVNRILNKIK